MEVIVYKIGDDLTKYLELLEDYLRGYSKEFLRTSREECGEEEDEKPFYWDEYEIYAYEYPNILRKSFLITCCSMLEHVLIQECKTQKFLKSLKTEIKDIEKGSFIDKVKQYLKDAGFNIVTMKSWEDIKNIQEIRNCIVHSEFVSNCKKPELIKNYIEKRKDIKDIFIENDKIILTPDYCRYVVDTFHTFEYDIKAAR